MDLEVDHLILFTAPGAPVVDRVAEAGFREGSHNAHAGQGTANRRVFFANAYLEFLFVVDREALDSPLIAPTGLAGRFTGGCPFGLVLRPARPGASAPFPTWSFTPPYLPDGTDIAMAASSLLTDEPLVAVIGFGGRPDSASRRARPALDHPAGPRSIRGLLLCGPWPEPPSPALTAVAAMPGVTLAGNDRYNVEVTLGDGPGHQMLDLRSDAALSLRW